MVTALSNMAAAARPPGIGDARVACPLCGGLVHPVAGRCKHCKEDLTALRAGRPQAAAPLPSLVGQPAQAAPVAHAPAPQPAMHGNPGYANGYAASVPVAIPQQRDASQPILPQRPMSQWRMKAQPRRSLLSNWPMIVIVVAVLAIVAAVVIMVLPQDSKKSGGKRQLMPTPAPDRMETNPLDKQSQIDPWQTPGSPPPAPRAPDPMPDDPPPPDDPDDIYGGLGGGGTVGGSIGGGMGNLSSTFMLTMLGKACTKLQSCPNADKSLSFVCDQFNAMPRQPVPSGCPSAQRCLDAIERIDCSAGASTDALSSVYLIHDCTKAATEC